MRLNGLLVTALIALGVVVAYDKYAGKSPMMRRAA